MGRKAVTPQFDKMTDREQKYMQHILPTLPDHIRRYQEHKWNIPYRPYESRAEGTAGPVPAGGNAS